jgi:hypothetical protein
MTAILRQLPFFDQPSAVRVRGAPVSVKAHQIIVWVSISAREVLALETNCPRFPAILDTGNTQTFSIRESHLRQWAGIQPAFLPWLGFVRHAGRDVPMHDARLWLHRNRPGQRDSFADATALRLDFEEGILVYPDGAPAAPRLPLLGLRALTENRLHLKVDAERLRVSLRSRDWVTRLLWWG